MRNTAEATLNLLIVEDDFALSYALNRWLVPQRVTPVLAECSSEAENLIQDTALLNQSFAGLLTDYELPDATGIGVIKKFTAAFPNRPVAVMTGSEDRRIFQWTTDRQIPIFKKPLDLLAMKVWLRQLRMGTP